MLKMLRNTRLCGRQAFDELRPGTFAQRYPSTVPAAQIYIINGTEPTTSYPRGAILKRVIGGVPQ